MRPGVHADFVTGHVLFDQDGRPLKHARAYNEEGGLDCFIVEVFEKRSTNTVSQMFETWPANRG